MRQRERAKNLAEFSMAPSDERRECPICKELVMDVELRECLWLAHLSSRVHYKSRSKIRTSAQCIDSTLMSWYKNF